MAVTLYLKHTSGQTGFDFSLFPGLLVPFLDVGNRLIQVGPISSTCVFTATIMASVPLWPCPSPPGMQPKETKFCSIPLVPLGKFYGATVPSMEFPLPLCGGL